MMIFGCKIITWTFDLYSGGGKKIIMKCQNCGADGSGRFCEYCGTELPYRGPEVINNDNSNTVINNYYINSVETYGAPVQQTMISHKTKTAALLWCIFLGYFGAHYFYVGKIGKGILYIFTVGLFGIGWIIDIFRIASNDFTDANGNKLARGTTSKTKVWLILMIIGIIGMLACASSGISGGTFFYVIWAGVSGGMYYRSKTKK